MARPQLFSSLFSRLRRFVATFSTFACSSRIVLNGA